MYNIRTSSKGRTQCRIPDCPTAQDDIHNSDGFLLGSFDFNNLRINQQNSSSKDDLSYVRQNSTDGLPKLDATNALLVTSQEHHKVASARHSCLPPVSPTAKMMYGGNRKYISVQRKRANRTLISDLVNVPDAKNAKLQSPVCDGENSSEQLIQLDSLNSDMKLVQSIKEVTSMMTESKQLNPVKTTNAGTSKPPLPPKRSNTARMTKQTNDHQIHTNSHTNYEVGKPHTIAYKPVSWNIDGVTGHLVLPTTLPGTIESRERFWVALHKNPARPNFPLGPSSTYVRPWEKTQTMHPPIQGPPSSTLVVSQPTSQMEKRQTLYSTVPYGFPACVVAPGPDNVPHTSYLGLHVHGHLTSRTVPRMGVDVKSVNHKNVPVNPVMVGHTIGMTGNAPPNKTVYQIPLTESVGNKQLSPTAKEHSLPPFNTVNLYKAKERSLPPLNKAQKKKQTSPPIIGKTNLAPKVKTLRPGTPKRQVYKTKPLCQSTPISYVATGGNSRQAALKDKNTDHDPKGVKPLKFGSPSTPVMKLKRHWTPAGPYHDKMSPSPRPGTIKSAATRQMKFSPKSKSRYATDVYAKLIATAHKKASRSPQSSQRKEVTGTELPFTPKRILSSKIRSKAFKLLNGKHQPKDTEQKDSALKETRENMETKSADSMQVIAHKGSVKNSKCGQKGMNNAKSVIDTNLDDLNPLSKTSPTIEVSVVRNVPVSSAETSLDSGVPNTPYNRNIDKNVIGQKPHKAVIYENKYSDISSADSEVTTNFTLKNSEYPSPPTLQKNNITRSESLIQNASDVSPPVLEKCGKCVTDDKNIEQPVSKSNTEAMSCDEPKNVSELGTGSGKHLPMGSSIHDSDFESFGSISLDSMPEYDKLSDSNPLGTSTMESLNVNESLAGSFVDDEPGKRDTSAGTATDTEIACLDRAIAESLHKMLNFQFRCKVPMHRNVKKFELSDKLKHVKPYLISGYVSETYLKTLSQRTHKMNLMFGNALDEVGDVDQAVLKKCQKSSPAKLAKDLVFRVFTLGELNNGMVMSKLSGVKLSAVRRCVRRVFPKMEIDDWALQCIPYIKNALKTLFTQRVPMVQQFWEKM